jgi:hemoglobin/transferrin/lactoferrin receptor protein
MAFTVSPLRLRTALLAGAAALAAAPAHADTDAGLTDTQPGSETSDVIVVRATRTRLSNFDYPGLTSVISLEQLEIERPSDLADTLRDMPGMEVSGGPRRTGQTLSMRGLSRQNVTLLLNGARQNYASAHDGVLFLDPGLLSRVETVRGPASALYGSGASGGVIAFETANADDFLAEGESFGARASAGYRSGNEETRGSLAVFGRTDRASGIAAVTGRQSGDIRLGSGDDLPSDDELVSTLLGGELRLTEDLTVSGSWMSFRNDVLEPNNGQGDAGVDGLNPLVRKDVANDTVAGTVRFNPAATGLVNIEATLYRSEGAVDEFDPLADRTVQRDLQTTGLRAENRAEFALGGLPVALTFGGEWYEDEQTGFDSATADGARGGVPTATTTFYGAYAQAETEFAAGPLPGTIILLPGVRWDRFESDSDISGENRDEKLSPRFAATWAPTDGLRLFASWAEAFRAPSLNELYIDGTHFSLPHPILGAPNFITNEFIPNPDLRPESTQTVEIGAGYVHRGLLTGDDRLEVKGAWFRTRADDLINLGVDFAFDPTCFAPPFAPCSAGVSYSENLESAELSGFEVSALYANGPLTLSGALYEVDGENRITGAPIGSLQPLMGWVRADYEVLPGTLDLGGRLGFAGDFTRTSDPNAERDGYAVLDLYAGWRPFADRRVRVDAGVHNVFDENYERVFAGVSEPGRAFRIDFSWVGGW